MPFAIITLVPFVLVVIAGELFLIACVASALEPLLWWAGWSRRSAVTLLLLDRSAANDPHIDLNLAKAARSGIITCEDTERSHSSV
jgi:hypothetical protein